MDRHHLARAREAAGLTQRELAARAGVCYVHLARIEAGKRPLTPEFWARVWAVLGREGNG